MIKNNAKDSAGVIVGQNCVKSEFRIRLSTFFYMTKLLKKIP